MKVQLTVIGVMSIILFLLGLSIFAPEAENIWSLISTVILMLLLSLAIPLLQWIIGNAVTITIDSKKFIKEFSFLVKNTTTIEAYQIEGVNIWQDIFARKFNYGVLTITGSGGKKIRTPVLDSPEEVAKEIRKINPKLS
jgi:uncharacterized membrane protein YdbT with pleckstrin-like domain